MMNPPSSTSTSTPTPTPKSQKSYLSTIPMGAPDAILGIAESYKTCPSPSKVNVCVGAYRDENGDPWILPSVRAAELKMLDDPAVTKEYAGIAGDPRFVELALAFAYGKAAADGPVGRRLAGIQTLSGTGACRIGGEFLARFSPPEQRIIYVPDPTWGNHLAIFAEAGLAVRRYRYYNPRTNRLDMEGMVEDLSSAPEGSVVLLHACAHNPTGCDPTASQWRELSALCLSRGLRVFFDSAYQGFASGDAEADAFALRLFVEEGHPAMMLAQSFAKNFGLYGERCGTLSIVCGSEGEREAVVSRLKLIVRPMYSSPPVHGAGIVRTVLGDEGARERYYGECGRMAERIGRMRRVLVEKLMEEGSTHDWSHVTEQIGMFAYTGMSAEMCDRLTSEFYIFLTRNGRVSLAGLNDGNVDYVARAIHAVTDGKSIVQE